MHFFPLFLLFSVFPSWFRSVKVFYYPLQGYFTSIECAMLRHCSMPGMSSWSTRRSLHLMVMVPEDPLILNTKNTDSYTQNYNPCCWFLDGALDSSGAGCLTCYISWLVCWKGDFFCSNWPNTSGLSDAFTRQEAATSGAEQGANWECYWKSCCNLVSKIFLLQRCGQQKQHTAGERQRQHCPTFHCSLL